MEVSNLTDPRTPRGLNGGKIAINPGQSRLLPSLIVFISLEIFALETRAQERGGVITSNLQDITDALDSYFLLYWDSYQDVD